MGVPDNTDEKQVTGRFKKGKSGNSKGRPKGALNQTTLAAQALLDGEAEALTRKAIELAKGGDITALRLCLDRLLPPRKDRPLVLAVPAIEDPNDLEQASAAVLRSVVAGEITPSEGQALASILEGHRKVVALADVERRLEELERRQGVR